MRCRYTLLSQNILFAVFAARRSDSFKGGICHRIIASGSEDGRVGRRAGGRKPLWSQLNKSTRRPPHGVARRNATPRCSKKFPIFFTQNEDAFDTALSIVLHCISLNSNKAVGRGICGSFRTSINADRKQLVTSYPARL